MTRQRIEMRAAEADMLTCDQSHQKILRAITKVNFYLMGNVA